MHQSLNALLISGLLTISFTATAQIPAGPVVSFPASVSGTVNKLINIVPVIGAGSDIASCSITPSLPGGVGFNSKTCVINGWPVAVLPKTTYALRVVNAAGGATAVKMNLTIAANVPILDYDSGTVKKVKVGDKVSIAPKYIHNGGSPIMSCTVSPALPAGLSLNNTTCVISGTPTTVSGPLMRFVKITNAVGSVSPIVTIEVLANAPALTYPASKITPIGSSLSIIPTALEARGAAITSCVATGLPAGVSINNTTCVISGTPTVGVSEKKYSVIVKNAAGSTEAFASFGVGSAPTLDYAASAGKIGKVGEAMSVTPGVLYNGGSPITSCKIASSSPALPTGLSINNTTCVISGTPTVAAASKTYSMTAANIVGSVTANVTLTINASLKYGTYENPFSKNSAWNIRPINPVLDTWEIPRDGMNGQNWYPSVSSGALSTGFYKALSTDGPMKVYGKAAKNNYIYDTESEAYRLYVEIPRWAKDTVAAPGGDGHADILDTVTGVIHSFWQLKYNDSLKRWEATTWNTTRIDGTGWGTPAKYMGGARAAGVPVTGGLIRKHEAGDASKDQFDHVIAMSMAASGLSPEGTGYVFPATSADWNFATSNYGKIPEGSLMMLPANFDLSKLGRAHSRKLAKTLMTYGARVVDANSHTPFAMYVEFGGQWPGHSLGTNGWDNTYANDLDKIRAGLKRVVSQSGWVDKDNKPVDLNPNGNGLNFISLRGDQVVSISATQPSTKAWWKNSGAVLGQFDPVKEEIVWGPTGAVATIQNSSNVGNRVAWGKFVTGARYKMTVTATNGATLNFQLINPDGSVAYQTTFRGQGDVPVEFNGISGTRPRVYGKSGVNVNSSSAKIFVTRIY